MKTITKFDFNTSNISSSGEIRKFNIFADKNAVFTLEILNEDGYYYNFSTKTFGSQVSRIENKIIRTGSYSNIVVFPAVTDDDHYDIRLWAHDIYDTKHAKYKEVRLGDGTLDVNSSSGSNSNLLSKKIYQYLDVNVTLSLAPRFSTWGSITAGTQAFSVSPLSNIANKHSFSITGTVAGDKGVAILRQPSHSDIYALETRQYGAEAPIPNEDPYLNERPERTVLSGVASSTNRLVLEHTHTFLSLAVGDAVVMPALDAYTDKTLLITHLDPDGDNAQEIQVSATVTADAATEVVFYPKGYYRYNVHANSSLHGITSGMQITSTLGVDPFITVSPYSETIEITEERESFSQRREDVDLLDDVYFEDREYLPKTSRDIFLKELQYKAVEPTSTSLTYTAGVISKQLGIITHSQQQHYGVVNQNFNVYAYGQNQIKSLTYCDAVFSNLKVELTELTTLVNGAVSNSTTVGVDDRSGFINNVTRIKAIGIDPSAGYPLVTAGGGNDGSGNLTISAAQTLEDNQTITLLGSGSVITITGEIEFKTLPRTALTLYFDASKFLLTN